MMLPALTATKLLPLLLVAKYWRGVTSASIPNSPLGILEFRLVTCCISLLTFLCSATFTEFLEAIREQQKQRGELIAAANASFIIEVERTAVLTSRKLERLILRLI